MSSCSVRMEALTVYTFHVTDSVTGAPVAGAQCAIVDRYEMIMPFEGAGCITGADGVCSVNVEYFPPRYYSVYKAGYKTARGYVPGTMISVALDPTAVLYWVSVMAGANGRVDPSGTFQVKANTKLTVTATPDSGYVLKEWLLNGAPSGNTNPIGVVIDRDSYSIAAVFKVAETPPPDGPTPPEWPVVKEIHLFDSLNLKAEWNQTLVKAARAVKNVDTGVLVGGRIDYSIEYTRGNDLPIRGRIFWNDTQYVDVTLRRGEPVTGSVDLTGLIGRNNTLMIQHGSAFGLWSEVVFDVWVVLGFSEEPVIDPGVPPEWDWWWPWAIAGGAIAITAVVGVVAYQEVRRREEMFLMMMRR